MENYIWLGSEPVILDRLDSDEVYSELISDSRIFTNDDYWLFCTSSGLESLKTDYPDIFSSEGDVMDWATYAAKDYWINSMEEIQFNDLVEEEDFIESITNKVNGSTREEIKSLDIENLTKETVKELIIRELQETIEKLS